MRRGALAPVLVVVMGGALAGAAQAEPRFGGRLLDEPDLPARASVGMRLARKMTLLTDDLGLSLSAATFGLIDLRADFQHKTGRLHVGGGNDEFGLHLDSKVAVHGSVARVDAQLQLAVLGKSLELDLPDVEVLKDSVAGQDIVQVRLPVFEGHF